MRRIVVLMLACFVADAMTDLRPGSTWKVNGNMQSGITMLSGNMTPPTKAEVEAWITTCLQQEKARQLLKIKARFDIKTSTTTAAQKIQSLITILDLDL
jgi:hypothetical protein